MAYGFLGNYKSSSSIPISLTTLKNFLTFILYLSNKHNIDLNVLYGNQIIDGAVIKTLVANRLSAPSDY